MSKVKSQDIGPRGGLRAGTSVIRGWRWLPGRAVISHPVRCRREQWYLARGKLASTASHEQAGLSLRFRHSDESVSERMLNLHAIANGGMRGELFGWVLTPEDATHLQLCLSARQNPDLFHELVFHPVAERDSKCHPLAAVPRWSSYQPPFKIERVYLPESLEVLTPLIPHDVQLLRPHSGKSLAKSIRGAACVLDPNWIRALDLRWKDIQRLAAEAWLIVDLATLAELLRAARLGHPRVQTFHAEHEIMSARVEYADVPTRGFALQDVFPYGAINDDGHFSIRVLRADRAWKRYADEVGFATLLASETPWPEQCGDVLSAACPVGRGELIATDLPWLVAGQFGALLAPRLTAHTLQMHLAGPVAEDVQYWNRWDDSQIVVRDISDLARRYPPLCALRWAATDSRTAPLGVCLPALDPDTAGRALLVRTGRIDNLAAHVGLPPEPLIVFMKMLVREARQRSAWARRYLSDLTFVWQFDTAAGLRYVANYLSAATVLPKRQNQIELTTMWNEALASSEGLFGDGSFEYQTRLNTDLRALIEQHST
ncbi:MAG: hypothetical protein ABIG44_17410 [Planctomycetota bacterium]